MFYRQIILFFSIYITTIANAQPIGKTKWAKDGNSYYALAKGSIVKISLLKFDTSMVADSVLLTLARQQKAAPVENFFFSADGSKLLIYTNSKRVWRYNTRGDYWVLNLATKSLRQIGKDKPASSLMFAKFSPDGSKIFM